MVAYACRTGGNPVGDNFHFRGFQMNKKKEQGVRTILVSRRVVIAGAAAVCGSAVLGGGLRGGSRETVAQASAEAPCKITNAQRTSLRQEVDLPASPERVYRLLLDSKQFTELSGMPAEINGTAGGAFAMFGKVIYGRFIELVPNQRVVQAWGDTGWGPSMYSVAKFDLQASGTGTRLVLDHTGFPEGSYDHLCEGWKGHYWDPMKKFLA
jgi:uncharacterized protein YndB with AHSA1/START domain